MITPEVLSALAATLASIGSFLVAVGLSILTGAKWSRVREVQRTLQTYNYHGLRRTYAHPFSRDHIQA